MEKITADKRHFYVVEIVLEDDKKYYYTWFDNLINIGQTTAFLHLTDNIDISYQFDSVGEAEAKFEKYKLLIKQSLLATIKTITIVECSSVKRYVCLGIKTIQ